MTKPETHPIINGYMPQNARILIMGTFPPKMEYTKKGEGFFFYSSEKNQFWNRIDNIFKEIRPLKKTKLKNKDESLIANKLRKIQFANQQGIAFIDFFSKIQRKKVGSSDNDIISIETILENGKLDNILTKNKIERICCTYSLAYERLKCGIGLTGYKVIAVKENNSTNKEKLIISRNNRSHEIVLLYPATRSRHPGPDKDNQYRFYLKR